MITKLSQVVAAIPNIEHLMKGKMKMKGAMKLFKDYSLQSEKGRPNRYDYSISKVSASETNGKAVFTIETESKSGREKLQTTDLSEVLETMRLYAPAKDWKLVAKV